MSQVLFYSEIFESMQIQGKPRASEHTAQDVHDEGNSRAFRTPERKNRPGKRCVRVRRGMAVSINGPVRAESACPPAPPR